MSQSWIFGGIGVSILALPGMYVGTRESRDIQTRGGGGGGVYIGVSILG